MSVQDVVIVITRETAALTQKGFGLPLILATSQAQEYTEYFGLDEVAADFAETTEEYKIANALFSQSPRPEKLAIYGVVYDSGTGVPTDLTAALNQLVGLNDDFYFLLSPEQGEAEINALASWTEAQRKIYFASTDDLTLPGNMEFDRTTLLIGTKPEQYPAEAWVGRCAPELPGAITWKFKNLAGIHDAGLTKIEIGQLHTDGGNSYMRKLGYLQTTEGKVTSGEFIDIIRSQDFVEARLNERISRLLFLSPKVPLDNSGIALVVAEVDAVMKQSTEQGIIARDDDGNGMYEVTAPDREDIDPNTRATRTLPDVRFRFTLAGAIHRVEVRGVIQV